LKNNLKEVSETVESGKETIEKSVNSLQLNTFIKIFILL
jgi:hypothetical protein